MKWFPVVCCVLLATPMAAQPRDADRMMDPGAGGVRPPVLAGAEPADSLVVMLPGAPPPAPAVAPPAPKPAAPPLPPAPAAEDDHRPVLRRAPKPILPAEFESDSGFFCQRLIGAWTQRDAYNLFGDPLRQRFATDEAGAVNGRIYAYSDPTGRYREIELDFASDSGLLRTVFVYPWDMSWQECRRVWGSNVQSAEANKGRIFYSYLNRRLDVLVDGAGRVISLGLY